MQRYRNACGNPDVSVMTEMNGISLKARDDDSKKCHHALARRVMTPPAQEDKCSQASISRPKWLAKRTCSVFPIIARRKRRQTMRHIDVHISASTD
jgi:hypothetical protein